MSSWRSPVRGATALALLVLGCGSVPATVDPVPPATADLPVLRVEQRAGADVGLVPLPLELTTPQEGERVTLTATGTDLRVLLAALADAANVDLVVAPEVQGLVTAHFEDVLAIDALRQVVLQTGYMITTPITPLWGPTVFYPVAVNVNTADVELIQARFGVSEELARFLVQARIPRPN